MTHGDLRGAGVVAFAASVMVREMSGVLEWPGLPLIINGRLNLLTCRLVVQVAATALYTMWMRSCLLLSTFSYLFLGVDAQRSTDNDERPNELPACVVWPVINQATRGALLKASLAIMSGSNITSLQLLSNRRLLL